MTISQPKPDARAADFRAVASSDMIAARRFLTDAAATVNSAPNQMSPAEFATAAATVANGFIGLAALGLLQAARLEDTGVFVPVSAEELRASRRRAEQAAEEARPHDDELVHTPGPDPDGRCPALDGDEPPFLGFTSHGHPIGGPVPEDLALPPDVARCGGPLICGRCALDAARLSREANRG